MIVAGQGCADWGILRSRAVTEGDLPAKRDRRAKDKSDGATGGKHQTFPQRVPSIVSREVNVIDRM